MRNGFLVNRDGWAPGYIVRGDTEQGDKRAKFITVQYCSSTGEISGKNTGGIVGTRAGWDGVAVTVDVRDMLGVTVAESEAVAVIDGVSVGVGDGVGVVLEVGVKVALGDPELDGDGVFEGVEVTEAVLVRVAVFVEDGDGD